MNTGVPIDIEKSNPPQLMLLGNMIAMMMGTSTLIAIHHYYRKQRHPNACIQDYLSGFSSKLQSLPSQSAAQWKRIHYAYLQATTVGHHAYQNYNHEKSNDATIDDKDTAIHFSAAHTTTLLTRHVQWVSGVASMPQAVTSTYTTDDDNDFGVVGIDADRQLVWQTTMPERVHDIVVQPVNNSSNDKNIAPRRDVAVMGRRPSEWFWVLDTANGQVQFAIKAAANRHFYGHACYSLDGTLLYVTENDTVNLVGKIGVYDVYQDYKKVAEFDADGIGPHELIMHPDGDTLIIANGGIKTEKASREELNLDTMQPALIYLNRHDGTLLERVTPQHNQMSIRHLAVHNNGTVVIGIQFQGDRHINVPLVLTHQRGETDLTPLSMPDSQWQRFHHYIASVTVDSEHNLVCATSPFGGCVAVYDLTTRQLIESISIPDCAGATVLPQKNSSTQNSTSAHDDNNDHTYPNNNENSGFIISDGLGQLTTLTVCDGVRDNTKKTESLKHIIKNSKTHGMSFDNHLQRL